MFRLPKSVRSLLLIAGRWRPSLLDAWKAWSASSLAEVWRGCAPNLSAGSGRSAEFLCKSESLPDVKARPCAVPEECLPLYGLLAKLLSSPLTPFVIREPLILAADLPWTTSSEWFGRSWAWAATVVPLCASRGLWNPRAFSRIWAWFPARPFCGAKCGMWPDSELRLRTWSMSLSSTLNSSCILLSLSNLFSLQRTDSVNYLAQCAAFSNFPCERP